MKKYKLAIFDWDGTLLDSTTQIINAVSEVAVHFSVRCPEVSEIKKCIGIKIDQAFDSLFPFIKIKEKIGMKNLFLELSKNENAPLYRGVKKLIHTLKEKKYCLAIATNRYSEDLYNDLRFHEMEEYFDQIVCANDRVYKPNPILMFSILKELKISTYEAVMIGDSLNDAIFAKNSVVDSVIVSNGLRDKHTFSNFHLKNYCETIGELESWFFMTEA